MMRRALTYTRTDVESVLDNLAVEDAAALAAATALFDEGLVAVVEDAALGGQAIGFELADPAAAASVAASCVESGACALLDGTLPRARGAVMKQGHADLKCSRGDACPRALCPFALAACFRALDDLGATVIPLYSEALDVSRAIARFRRTWGPRLIRSDTALNLLLARSEDDFAGVLVVDDDTYLDEFTADLAHILAKMGKIDEDALERRHIGALLRSVNPVEATFHATRDENLAARRLYVVDRLDDFFERDPERDFSARYLVERFGHVVDHRYLVLAGTKGELARFLGLSPTLELLLGEHRLELAGLSAADVYELYLDELDEALRAEADDAFRDEFIAFVEFNMDILPFRGKELADYLAKTANARGTLTLPPSRYRSSSLAEMLDDIVGLRSVKETIRQLEAYALFAKQAEGRGLAMPKTNLHMAFMGNPGTGKTTVARIIATMLYKIGIISQNKCVEVTSKDLIARYVGHTDKQVFDVVQRARGGVLFIDEAYALVPDAHHGASFGYEALAELVKLMEDYRDDLVVIVAGYEREMADFIDANPGLASRIGYTFHFADLTREELAEVFAKELARGGFEAAPGVDARLDELFGYFAGFKSFGNGRFACEVLQRALIKHAVAARDAGCEASRVIEADDIPTRREMMDVVDGTCGTADELMADLVGLAEVKERVREIERVTAFRARAAAEGLALPPQNLHMALTGPAGTGKTTVARIIGRILFSAGAVPGDRFTEVQAKDLVSWYVGGTSEETAKLIERALGGVLFIDEAYALVESSSGQEALAVLVKAMEDRKGELVVMLAGYDGPMRAFMDANPGLASRIGYRLRFEDYEPDDLTEMFRRKMEAAGFVLGEGTLARASEALRYFHNVENFGNGRFADEVVQQVIARRAARADGDVRVIEADDVPGVEHFCKLSATPVLDPVDAADAEARRRVAAHEAGHAVVGLAETGRTDIKVITIEQEGTGTLGYVQHEKKRDRPLPTAADLRAELAMLMAGMAAEERECGAFSAGNSSDLAQATACARSYAATFGMSEAGLVQLVPPAGGPDACKTAELPAAVLAQMNDLLATALERARTVIEENQEAFEELRDALLAGQTLRGEEIAALWERHQSPAAEEASAPAMTDESTIKEHDDEHQA